MNECISVNSLIQFSNKVSAHQYYKPFTIISSFLKPESKALDWGSGNGHLSTFLLHNQQRTTAYAFGENLAPQIIADNPLFEFVAADTKEPVKLPFGDNSFDLVLSMGVLEHVHESGGDQLSSLREIKRILKQDGFFLCFHFPYSGSWVEKLRGAIMPFKKRKTYVHTKRFSKEDTSRLCNESELTLNEWGRYNFLPRNISRQLPCSVANNNLFLASYNGVDAALSYCLPWFCNQSYFIAQKQK